MVSMNPRSDPASVSRLGGALRSTAAGLAARAEDLGPSSELAQLAGRVVDQLDTAGSALQVHAQELAEAEAVIERITERAAAAGLVVDGWRVVEPLGVIRADEARRRLLAQPELQHQLDRAAGRLGRANAQLDRLLQGCGQQLTELSRIARSAG